MQMLLDNQVEAVSGGAIILDIANYAKLGYEIVVAAGCGAINVMQFTGEDMFLEALRGGNLGA
jgi:hypothetical protein